MIQAYVIIDETNTVINIVLWDGETVFDVSPNTLQLTNDDANAQIGGTFFKGVFTPAPPPIMAPPIDTPAKAIAALNELLGGEVASLISVAAGIAQTAPAGAASLDQAESVPSVGP